MKQVLLKQGGVVVEEVPAPQATPGRVLVRTAYSCISVGTEMSGDKAKAMKREINTQWIYPPRANRADAFKAAEWARLVDY